MNPEDESLFDWARKYHARVDDPDTSFIAELLLNEETVQAMLRMDLLVHGRNPAGLTDEEVSQELALLFPAIRIHDRNHSKRCSDLEIHLEFLEDSGLRRINSTGRPAKVRRITQKGIDALKSRIRFPRLPPSKGVEVELVFPEEPIYENPLAGSLPID
jgi:hypothetical protein